MALSQDERQKIERKIKNNTWFTYEEAETELRKHWNTSNSQNGDYLLMKRRQIQKIIKSDVIGTYLKINKRQSNISDETWFNQTIYGWTEEKNYTLYLPNGKENTVTEKLHVFPKYDNLFDNQESIILSSLDEELDDDDKTQMREIFEELHGSPGKGKTKYLMTEPYLFALKHEVERREYPTKTLYLKPHSPKEILSNFDNLDFRKNILANIDKLIDDFEAKINSEINKQQNVRKAEWQRYQDIADFIRIRGLIYPDLFSQVNQKLEEAGLLTRFKSKMKELNEVLDFQSKDNLEKEKLHKKYSVANIKNLSDEELKKQIKNSIYSFENYNLSKLEFFLTDDNANLNEAMNFRQKFIHCLYHCLKECKAESFIFDSLNDVGIRDFNNL